jgi:REP element-mobilizing transposase RayT
VQYIDGAKNDGWLAFDQRVWQRNFYEHVIRNQDDLSRIRRYITENPARWDRNRYHVAP